MVDFNKLQLTVLEENNKFGKYEIGPVARGFGSTLVNPLRRVLLSSITGTGVVSVKIGGVKHEFSTLKGLEQDLLDIVLNIKNLPVSCKSEEPQTLKLSVSGKRVVTAADFEKSHEVDVVDPDFVVATLADDKSKLDLEVVVERGTGYKAADDSARKKIGVVPLDVNYSPVERVKFEIMDTRVGRRTDFDKVLLEIYTDGSEKPGDCLTEATEILVKMYAALSRESELVARILENKDVAVEVKEVEVEETELPEMSIDDLRLPSRALNSLKGAGIETTSQLTMMTMKDVEALEGLGKKSVEDIEKALAKQGLGLKD